mgnify:CR=1 FL=1
MLALEGGPGGVAGVQGAGVWAGGSCVAGAAAPFVPSYGAWLGEWLDGSCAACCWCDAAACKEAGGLSPGEGAERGCVASGV